MRKFFIVILCIYYPIINILNNWGKKRNYWKKWKNPLNSKKMNFHAFLEFVFKNYDKAMLLKDIIWKLLLMYPCLFPFILWNIIFWSSISFLQAYSFCFFYLLRFRVFHRNVFQNGAIRIFQWLFPSCSRERGKLWK